MVGFAYGDGRTNNLQTVDCEANRMDGDIVITWSRFTFYHKTELKLQRRFMGPHLTDVKSLQTNNACLHTARVTAQNPGTGLAFTSPDLTPIEHVWDKMGCELHSRKWQFTSQQLYSLGACQEQSTTSVFSDC